MKPIWKILLFVALGLIVLHLCPLLLVPVMLGLAATLVIGIVMLSGVATVAATGLSVVAGLLVVVLVLLAVLSPIWLPVLAIVGLVSLCRRRHRTAA